MSFRRLAGGKTGTLVSLPIGTAPARPFDASGAPAFQPAPGTDWQIQLTGALDTSFDVVLYEVDLFDTDPSVIAGLAVDQLAYNQWIAGAVHALGMAVFQKNDLDQISALEPSFDGILDEECNKYSECDTLAP